MPLEGYFLEDGTHFPILHLIFPFLVAYVFYDNMWVVVSAVYLWESFEVLLQWVNGDYSVGGIVNDKRLFPSEPGAGIETVEDSLLLDPLQAAIAIALFQFLTWRQPDRWYTKLKPLRVQLMVFLAVFGGSSSYLMEMVIADMHHLGYLYFCGQCVLFLFIAYTPHSHGWREFAVSLILLLIVPMIPMTHSYVYRTWAAAGTVVLWKSIILLGEYGRHKKKKKKKRNEPEEEIPLM